MRRAMLILAAGCGLCPGVMADPPTSVPVRSIILSDGVERVGVRVVIAGRPIEAMLDTGSRGLRVLAIGASPPPAGLPERYAFSSGVVLEGMAAPAMVALGTRSAVVQVQFVSAVHCVPTRSACPAARVPQSAYRIGGDGLALQGFEAILGIGNDGRPGPDPLAPLGLAGWSLRLPSHPGGDGRLEILGSGGASDPLSGCIVNQSNGRRHCGRIILDTGTFGIELRAFDVPMNGSWQAGSVGRIEFADNPGCVIRFVAGAPGTGGIPVHLVHTDGASSRLVIGLTGLHGAGLVFAGGALRLQNCPA